MSERPATHAGSWYSNKPSDIQSQLESYLNLTGRMAGPVPGARVVISPHAGYRYCGRTMAYSYASLDLKSTVRRIFVLGPSHHIYFKNQVLLSGFQSLETPLGSLQVDREVCEKLQQSPAGSLFGTMDAEADMDEHSLEMQFPMLVQALLWREIPLEHVKVVPILVSHNSTEVDWAIGRLLRSYFEDAENLFVISSDFCHWGRRFGYTGYVGSNEELQEALKDETEIEMLTARSKLSHHQVDVWQSIELLDRTAMQTLSSNDDSKRYQAWKSYLEVTSNTICGARPIAVLLAMLAQLDGLETNFEWPHYSQSSHVKDLNDSSVSYASGFATVHYG